MHVHLNIYNLCTYTCKYMGVSEYRVTIHLATLHSEVGNDEHSDEQLYRIFRHTNMSKENVVSRFIYPYTTPQLFANSKQSAVPLSTCVSVESSTQ